MTTTILLVPVLLGAGLYSFVRWRPGRGKQPEVAPGRVVIASNLVSSRRR